MTIMLSSIVIFNLLSRDTSVNKKNVDEIIQRTCIIIFMQNETFPILGKISRKQNERILNGKMAGLILNAILRESYTRLLETNFLDSGRTKTEWLLHKQNHIIIE